MTFLLPKMGLLATIAFTGWVDPLGAIKCPSLGECGVVSGGNAGGTGVWILPLGASPASPQFAVGELTLKDDGGQPFVSPGHLWVRADNHLVLFYESVFIGAHLDYFDPAHASSYTLDETLTAIGDWSRDN